MAKSATNSKEKKKAKKSKEVIDIKKTTLEKKGKRNLKKEDNNQKKKNIRNIEKINVNKKKAKDMKKEINNEIDDKDKKIINGNEQNDKAIKNKDKTTEIPLEKKENNISLNKTPKKLCNITPHLQTTSPNDKYNYDFCNFKEENQIEMKKVISNLKRDNYSQEYVSKEFNDKESFKAILYSFLEIKEHPKKYYQNSNAYYSQEFWEKIIQNKDFKKIFTGFTANELFLYYNSLSKLDDSKVKEILSSQEQLDNILDKQGSFEKCFANLSEFINRNKQSEAMKMKMNMNIQKLNQRENILSTKLVNIIVSELSNEYKTLSADFIRTIVLKNAYTIENVVNKLSELNNKNSLIIDENK